MCRGEMRSSLGVVEIGILRLRLSRGLDAHGCRRRSVMPWWRRGSYAITLGMRSRRSGRARTCFLTRTRNEKAVNIEERDEEMKSIGRKERLSSRWEREDAKRERKSGRRRGGRRKKKRERKKTSREEGRGEEEKNEKERERGRIAEREMRARKEESSSPDGNFSVARGILHARARKRERERERERERGRGE